MPQRGFKIEAINWDDYLVPILEPTDQRALERIGFGKNKWDELNWYVRFAQMDLDNASQGDFLSLQEEFAALVTVHFRSRSPESVPSRKQIIEIQRTVLKHLTDLVDRGETCLPSLPGFLNILYCSVKIHISFLKIFNDCFVCF